MKHFVVAALLLASGCAGFTYVEKQCPTCIVVEAGHALPKPRATTQTVWLFVPGLLGFGWEWDKPIARLRATPATEFYVFWWRPFASLAFAGGELRSVLRGLLVTLPAAVTRIVVIGHSVGGMVAVEALRDLEIPDGRHVDVVTVGSPFAGMALSPDPQPNPRQTPLYLALSGQFSAYAPVPRRARVIEYVTSYPADPVMQPHNDHNPADPSVDPRGATRVNVDPQADHNQILDFVVGDVLRADAH